jgi:hypothetical protein
VRGSWRVVGVSFARELAGGLFNKLIRIWHCTPPCSRATVTFVGWLLACTGNFGMMVASAHLEAPTPCTKGDAQCPAAAAKATQAETATEVAASTA